MSSLIKMEVSAKLQVHETSDPNSPVVSEQCIDDDITLNNFLKWMQLQFSLNGSTGVSTNSSGMGGALTDTGGSSRDLTGYVAGTSSNAFNHGITATSFMKVFVGDGNGAVVTPVRNAFKLVATTPLSASCNYPASLGTNTISVVGVILNGATPFTAREVGLGVQWNANGTPSTILLFHDGIADTPVAANQAVTITYTFTFP